jgi:hypothetical protein
MKALVIAAMLLVWDGRPGRDWHELHPENPELQFEMPLDRFLCELAKRRELDCTYGSSLCVYIRNKCEPWWTPFPPIPDDRYRPKIRV